MICISVWNSNTLMEITDECPLYIRKMTTEGKKFSSYVPASVYQYLMLLPRFVENEKSVSWQEKTEAYFP